MTTPERPFAELGFLLAVPVPTVPTTTYTPTSTWTPEPTTTWTPTTTYQAPATTTAQSSSQTYSGTATFFYQKGVAGACGAVNPDSAMIVAIDSAMYAGGANCGRQVRITGNGKTIYATVR